MRNNLLKKGLVIGIIILFFGIAVQPITSSDITQKGEIEQVDEIEQTKDYLFQTLIDIANNPDVKELLKGNYEVITSDYEFKSVFRQILFKKPMLFFSMLFTRPKLTHKYLDTSYNRGCEITNVIGEDKTLDIIESIGITNPKILDDLNNIIMINEELSNKIIVIVEMNKVLKPDAPFEDYPLICGILLLIFFSCFSVLESIGMFLYLWGLDDNPIIAGIFRAIALPIYSILYNSAVLYASLDCPDPFPYP